MNEQATDNDILAWLQGRCMKINIVSDTGEDAVVWSAEDGTSIADMVLGYCRENNIDLLKEINSGCIETVELTTATGSREEIEAKINDCWADGIRYKGLDVFQALYANNDGEDGVYHPNILRHLPGDDFQQHYQECYLGYLADQDRFLVGFDTWPEEDEDTYSVFSFKLTDAGKVTQVEPVPGMEPTFYRNNWKALKERYASLYDIRLD